MKKMMLKAFLKIIGKKAIEMAIEEVKEEAMEYLVAKSVRIVDDYCTNNTDVVGDHFAINMTRMSIQLQQKLKLH